MADNPLVVPLQSPIELKAQIEAERSGAPFLLYRDGSGEQQIFPLAASDRVTVGRTASDILLDWDTEVSRLHAELERIGDQWTVSDDGLSRNGTYVNGERTIASQLMNGDVIDFGPITDAVTAAGYSGYVEVEIFNAEVWAAPADQTAAVVRERFAAVLGDLPGS